MSGFIYYIIRKGSGRVKALQHFMTINHHRYLVRKSCFRVGLYWQGLTHDLSKYSLTEFLVGARYFQGNRSPNGAEREEKGYSTAWIHHKGRNRHHWEYWTDMNMVTKRYEPIPMPRKYLCEMVMDRRAACIVYEGAKYTDRSALAYFERSREKELMHPQTRRELQYLLEMLRDHGEKHAFQYLKKHVLKGYPIPWETE